jgi:hypothetical protein
MVFCTILSLRQYELDQVFRVFLSPDRAPRVVARRIKGIEKKGKKKYSYAHECSLNLISPSANF